jgi:hypothetical protein
MRERVRSARQRTLRSFRLARYQYPRPPGNLLQGYISGSSSRTTRTKSKRFFAVCIHRALLRPEFKRAKIAVISASCGDIV